MVHESDFMRWAADSAARKQIAYDLALRIEGLHMEPRLTEEQALQVYRRALQLEEKLAEAE